MSKLTIGVFCCCTLFICLADAAMAQRSSVVIGESLANVKHPKADKLKSPFGVDFDQQGNMYIVELSGGRVHKLDSAGILTTIAGDGSKGYTGDNGSARDATFNGMHNVAVTPAGDLYIADSWNHCVRRIDGQTGIITTVAGTGKPGFRGDGGPATEAEFNYLMCVTLNSTNDKLYIADLKNLRIRMVDLKTGVVSTVAGNGKKGVPVDGSVATESPLIDPRAVAVDSKGKIYILERKGHALRVVTSDGKIRTVAGTGKPGAIDGAALKAQLNSPKHLAVDRDDNVIIADDQNARIRFYDSRNATLTSILGKGVQKPKRGLLRPHGVCVHEDGSIYVADSGNHRILRLRQGTNTITLPGAEAQAQESSDVQTMPLGKAGQVPNIVVIFNDDQGYQDLGCFGSPNIKTPRVDQMAAEGMKFTSFMVASSVCSPSRAALLTGCYPNRVGVPSVLFPDRGKGGLPPEQVTIAEMLKTVGYNTAAVGKWHLGDEPKYLPTNQGFDSYYGIPYSNDMFPASNMKYADDCMFREGQSHETLKEAFTGKLRNGNPVSLKKKVPLMRGEECIEFPADQTTITRRFTDEGIDFISASVKEDKPFFLYLAHSMPHIPLYVSPEFDGKSARGLYGDVIEEIDFNTGRILDHLKALEIEENTLVIFTSDNGPWLVMKENGGSALPLFEGKMTTFEGGQRVPCVMKWPARIPAGTLCDKLAATIDLLPTFAAITGAELPTVQPLDGKNILDLLTNQLGAESPHDFFFYGQAAVRHGDWKYHSREHFKVQETARKHKGPTLYNLKDDIGESNNVIAEYPEIAELLAKVLESNPNKRVADVKRKSNKNKKK